MDAEFRHAPARWAPFGLPAYHTRPCEAGASRRRQLRKTFCERGRLLITYFVTAMLRADRDTCGVPSYLICDRRFIADYGLGLIRPGTRNLQRFVRGGYLREADTIDGSALAIGAKPATIRATVERYNRFAETGVDEEFGRGGSALNRFNGESVEQSEPLPAPHWARPILCSGGLAVRSRQQRRSAH